MYKSTYESVIIHGTCTLLFNSVYCLIFKINTKLLKCHQIKNTMIVKVYTERIDFGVWEVHFEFTTDKLSIKHVISEPFNLTLATWENLFNGIDTETPFISLRDGCYYMNNDTIKIVKEHLMKPLRIAIEDAELKEYEFAE